MIDPRSQAVILSLQSQLDAALRENAELKLAAALAEKETLQANLTVAQTNLDAARASLADAQANVQIDPKVNA